METTKQLRIGILELQGDFAEHSAMTKKLGALSIGVREPSDLSNLDGLIIPGGESTTIGKLLAAQNLLLPIQELVQTQNFPIFGTCAGCILLSKSIKGHQKQIKLDLMHVCVDRNAYGPQISSCELRVQSSHKVFRANDGKIGVVLIRAPEIVQVGEEVEVLARYEGKPILVKEGNLIAATFHPELTMETKIHEFFLDVCRRWREEVKGSAEKC